MMYDVSTHRMTSVGMVAASEEIARRVVEEMACRVTIGKVSGWVESDPKQSAYYSVAFSRDGRYAEIYIRELFIGIGADSYEDVCLEDVYELERIAVKEIEEQIEDMAV